MPETKSLQLPRGDARSTRKVVETRASTLVDAIELMQRALRRSRTASLAQAELARHAGRHMRHHWYLGHAAGFESALEHVESLLRSAALLHLHPTPAGQPEVQDA